MADTHNLAPSATAPLPCAGLAVYNHDPGSSLVVALISALTGLPLIGMGLLSQHLRRIHDESKHKRLNTLRQLTAR